MANMKSQRLLMVIAACILSDYVITVHAHICEVGRERNRYNEWKWVLSYPNRCECTKIIMGGMNAWTPIRPFVPVYVDSPLLSDNVSDIRQHYGLTCESETLPHAKAARSTNTPPVPTSKDSTENTATNNASEDAHDLGISDTSESNPTLTSTEAGTTINYSANNKDTTSADAGATINSSANIKEGATSTLISTSSGSSTVKYPVYHEHATSTTASTIAIKEGATSTLIATSSVSSVVKYPVYHEHSKSTAASTIGIKEGATSTLIATSSGSSTVKYPVYHENVTSTAASTIADARNTIKSSANNEDTTSAAASTSTKAVTTFKLSDNSVDTTSSPALTSTDTGTTIKSSDNNEDATITPDSTTSTSARTTIKYSAYKEGATSIPASTSTGPGTTIKSLVNNEDATDTPISTKTDGTTIKSSTNKEHATITHASTSTGARTATNSPDNNEDATRTLASTINEAGTGIKFSPTINNSTVSDVLTTIRAAHTNPQECYTRTDGRDYRGQVSVTVSGIQCQLWTSQSPQSHSRTPANYPNDGLGPHNLCRNPDRESGAWCYTTDPAKRWESCNVGEPKPSCDCILHGTATSQGMEDGRIADSQITGNGNTYHFYVYNGRLNNVELFWSALISAPIYMQIDFLKLVGVTGIQTQGATNVAQWVTSLQIATGTSSDTITPITENGEAKTFLANTNNADVITILLPEAVVARYLRINIIEWIWHPSLRMEVLGYDHTVCHDYLGMKNSDIPDENIKASISQVSTEISPNHAAKNGRLDSNAYWRDESAESAVPWIQADIGYQTNVSGVITQGRDLSWVTTFKVSTFLTGGIFEAGIFIKDEDGNDKIFEANTDDGNSTTKSMFPKVLYAQIIRITCINRNGDYWIMRFEILGCKRE